MGDLWLKIGVTVITTLVSFGLWEFLSAWKRQRDRGRLRREALEYAQKHGGQREFTLLVSVGHDIRTAANGHLEGLGKPGMPVLVAHKSGAFAEDEADWQAFLDEVKAQVHRLRELNATRIYLFTNVPVAMAAMVGATLANGPEVIIHHYNANRYTAVGRVTTETTKF